MQAQVPTPLVKDDMPTPPTEAEAREFITIRFRAAGYQPVADYSFQAPGLACVLDGFDPENRVGFVYVSHEDVDVVSDIGHAEELAFKSLYDMNDAYIMVIHDHNIDALSTLEFRLDEFLRGVHRRRSK